MTREELSLLEEAEKNPPIVIAGGGIAGMFCALELASNERNKHPVWLLEALKDDWGGRISTVDMDGFRAEYGPMRFELGVQPILKALLAELKLPTVPFEGPSPGKIEYPKYDLPEEERGPIEKPYTSLELLKRGVLRIMGQKGDPRSKEEQEWIDARTEKDYEEWRKSARLGGRLLHDMGFWNALSAEGVLSHQALMRIRDTGTFYHLIPDNVNAVEWTIWWLRALRTEGEKMVGIDGGSRQLTVKLRAKLAELRVNLVDECELRAFGPRDQSTVNVSVRRSGVDLPVFPARHLILALPKAPLQKLAGSLPTDVRGLLDTAEGYPLTKVFFVTTKPYWNENTPAQYRAERMPTREIHYAYRKSDKRGMALVYTDRPATEYWNLYVVDRASHARPEIKKNPELVKQFARFLAKEAKAALEKGSGSELRLDAEAAERFAVLSVEEIASEIEESVVTYGIQDWSAAPHGGAFHAWRPGAKSWEVRDRFKAFQLRPGQPRNVHICGEAYSSYQGFIEGALRSACLVLTAILGSRPKRCQGCPPNGGAGEP